MLRFEVIEEHDDERLVLERFSKNGDAAMQWLEAEAMMGEGELHCCSSMGIVGDNDEVSVEDDIYPFFAIQITMPRS